MKQKEEKEQESGQVMQRSQGNVSPLPHQVDRVEAVKEQVKMIERLYREVLKKDVHYGVIPNTSKPTLLKAGAEKIVEMFQLCPEIKTTKEWLDNGHMNIEAVVRLLNREGQFIASGSGSCSTLESKYRYRTDGNEVIGVVPQAYWESKDRSLLKGGMTKKIDGLWMIVKSEKKENPNIADQYNTVMKMAVKRALVASTLMLGASDIFTQDMEDIKANESVIDSTAETLPEKTTNSTQTRSAPASHTKTPTPAPEPRHEQKKAGGSDPKPAEGTRKPLHIDKLGIDEVIGFGKFKGHTFRTAPSWWLEWLSLNCDNKQGVMDILEERMVEKVKLLMATLKVNENDLQNLLESKWQVQSWNDLDWAGKKNVLEYLDNEVTNAGK